MLSKRTDQAAVLLNVLQLLIDLAASLSGFLIAFFLYSDTNAMDTFKHNPHTPEPAVYVPLSAAFAIIVLISFTVKHLYQSRETGLMNMDEATRDRKSTR